MMRKAFVAMLVLMLLTTGLVPMTVLAGPTAFPSSDQYQYNAPSEQNNTTDPMLVIGTRVKIDTNWGNMVLGMYDHGAPITVSNFLNLTRSAFYDGIKFHRIIDGFVIQTGDPNSKDNNPYNDGYGGSGETIPLEVSSNLTHIDGAVGMARSSDPNSATSQFYICDGPQHGLDGNYAVFAVVVEGMDTVMKISAAPTYGYKRPALKDHPIDDIILNEVSILPNWTVPENPNDNNPYLFGSGDNSGLGLLFWIGLIVIIVVFVALVARRALRRYNARRTAEAEEQVYEAEVVQEEWTAYDGPGTGEGRVKQGGRGQGANG
jgi:peptidyl-prolyl cis-trans isomerase B (cyclophilin B)